MVIDESMKEIRSILKYIQDYEIDDTYTLCQLLKVRNDLNLIKIHFNKNVIKDSIRSVRP